MAKPRDVKGKMVNILGKRVKENDLKAVLRDVVKRRGLSGTLLLEKKMSRKERLKLIKSIPGYLDYANIYKYAFF